MKTRTNYIEGYNKNALVSQSKSWVKNNTIPLIWQEAIAAESYYEPPVETEMGDIQQGFLHSEKIIEGEAEIGGQLHFYMETQRSLVVPRDGGELEVFPGAQNPTSAQVYLQNDVSLKFKIYTCI